MTAPSYQEISRRRFLVAIRPMRAARLTLASLPTPDVQDDSQDDSKEEIPWLRTNYLLLVGIASLTTQNIFK